jgi:hypothetical protein
MSVTPTANSKLGDYFVRLPKLAIDGSNWLVCKNRFTFAVQGAGLGKYLEQEAPKKPNVAAATVEI